MKQITTLLILSLCTLSLIAQDGHFSQYFNAPLYQNPALTGQFKGDARLIANYRKQWLTNDFSYSTYNLSFDKKIKDLGIGAIVANNTAGPFGVRNFHLSGSASYSKQLGYNKNNLLSGGIQLGMLQRTFDPDNLAFDQQYTLEFGYDPLATNGENFESSRKTYLDLNAGVFYNFSPRNRDKRISGNIGAAVYHITEPKERFNVSEDAYIGRKHLLSATLNIRAADKILINPNLQFAQQHDATGLNGGLIASFYMSQTSKFDLGLNYRASGNDVLIPYIGISSKSLVLAASYDVNISSLKRATNMHGGLEVALMIIPSKSRSDIDKDGILDKVDNCPEVQGLRELGGCPDTDLDGIADFEDQCPTVYGLIENGGCPANQQQKMANPRIEQPNYQPIYDADKDGIPDNEDRCPTWYGTKENFGCPNNNIDADNDGIPNKIDQCPAVYGYANYAGCPDSDQDGIADYKDQCPYIQGPSQFGGCPESSLDFDFDGIPNQQDKCPNLPGLQQFGGCPDSDKDGIADDMDKCPMIPGDRSNEGCPYMNNDYDKDRVINDLDVCPYVFGEARFNGCPDTDGDLVMDVEDNCPLIVGEIDNYGCPK